MIRNLFIFSDRHRQLQATLGANGIRTSELETAADVIECANTLFSLSIEQPFEPSEEDDRLDETQDALVALGWEARGKLALRNASKLAPNLTSRTGKGKALRDRGFRDRFRQEFG